MAVRFTSYPPKGHKPRIIDYARYELLFRGEHNTLFNITPDRFQLRRYIVANFAGLISRLAADLLFGEEPDFNAPSGEEPAQLALDRLVMANNLHTVNYESALSNSFRGDAIYKVRWGKRTPQSEAPEAIIEEVPASIYFPELDDDDVRRVLNVTLAWLKTDPKDPKITYIRVEYHEPGLIRHELYRMGGGKAAEQVPLASIEAYADLPEEEPTQLTIIPIFHVPNFRYGSVFWGISDYVGLESLFEALNNRASQIDHVLDKHVAPKIILPPGFVDENGKVMFDQMETIVLEPGDQPPSYLTWEGQLTAAGAQLERLLDLLFMLSETAPSAFQMDKYGIAESGRALRLRLLRTLAKINRKRLYYDTGLKQALLAAQQFEVSLGGADYEPEEPVINWADGLPEDTVEMVEIESQRMSAGNTSVESSIRRLEGPDAVDAEIARIEGEAAQLGPAVGATLTPTLRRGREVPPAE